MGLTENAHFLQSVRQTQLMEQAQQAQGIDLRTPGPLTGQQRFVFWALIVLGFLFPPVWLGSYLLARQQRRFTDLFSPTHPFVPSATGWKPNPAFAGQITPDMVPSNLASHPVAHPFLAQAPIAWSGPPPSATSTARAIPGPEAASLAERLDRLAALREGGTISDSEYQEQRARILGSL